MHILSAPPIRVQGLRQRQCAGDRDQARSGGGKKKKKNEKPKYPVTANAYDDYCEGKLTADGLTPTLDADKCDVLLISRRLWIQT